MNRVGRLLICIAGGVALSVTAYGGITPPTVPPNVSAMRQNTNLMNRLMLLKKRQHPQGASKDFSEFARPFVPKPGIPPANIAQSHGATVAAPHPAATAPAAMPPASPGNPYGSIVTRNVFGLNPIPPYVAPPVPTGPPPPKITLTGITTIFGPPQALFKVAGVVRGNGRPQDESYIFTEGQEQDDVTVKTIDIKKQMVTFMNHGVEQEIPLVDTGVASSGPAPSAPAWPGQQRRFPRFNRFNNGGTPGFQPQTFGTPQPYNNSYNSQSGNNSSQSGQNNIYNPSAAAVNAGLTGDDEAALIAAQHAQMQQQGNPMSAIMPPTPLDKEAGVGPEAGAPDPTGSQGNPNPTGRR